MLLTSSVIVEDVGITLASKLRDPFVCDAAGTQPSCRGGTQVIDSEIRNSCAFQRFPPSGLENLVMTGRVFVARNKNGPVSEMRIWFLKASTASGVKGISATPFGVLESGIYTVALARSTWSFPWESVPCRPGGGKLGNSGWGICTAPGNADVDFSLRKNFKLTKRVKMQFQLDFFNLFNHPQFRPDSVVLGLNFSAPQLVAGNPATAEFLDQNGAPIYPRVGVTNSTGCNGATHLADPNGTSAQTACAFSVVNTTLTPNQSFGLATQSRENGYRQIQYGLKFSF